MKSRQTWYVNEEVNAMDPIRDLPLGFGMALARHFQAMQRFSAMSPEQRQTILNQLDTISSKEEMDAFVQRIAPD